VRPPATLLSRATARASGLNADGLGDRQFRTPRAPGRPVPITVWRHASISDTPTTQTSAKLGSCTCGRNPARGRCWPLPTEFRVTNGVTRRPMARPQPGLQTGVWRRPAALPAAPPRPRTRRYPDTAVTTGCGSSATSSSTSPEPHRARVAGPGSVLSCCADAGPRFHRNVMFRTPLSAPIMVVSSRRGCAACVMAA
jgi:hypothetical protein